MSKHTRSVDTAAGRTTRRGTGERTVQVAVCILTVWATACVEQHPQSGQTAPVAAAGASGGAGSAGGAAGAAGQGWYLAPIEPLPPAVPPIECGPVLCPAPHNIAGELLRTIAHVERNIPDAVACCVDPDRGICGTAASSDDPCDSPTVLNPQCPGIDLSALAALVGGFGKDTPSDTTGCCTRDACGIDGLIFGRGCVENNEMRRILSAVPIVGPLITVPQPAVCESLGETPDGGFDPALDSDAGM